MRRRSQLKRGALYTANPLLPDPLDQRVGCRDCLCPPRGCRAAAKKESDLCRSSMQAMKKSAHGERWRSFTAFIAPPSCYAPARQAWDASHPSNAAETSETEPCGQGASVHGGRFSLQPTRRRQQARFGRVFRQDCVTHRNVNLPNQIFLKDDCKLTLGSFLRKRSS